MKPLEMMKFTDEELIAHVGTSAETLWMSLEMMRRLKNNVDTLTTSVDTLNETSSKQATTMIRLTRVIIILTVVLVIGLGVQIWLAWK